MFMYICFIDGDEFSTATVCVLAIAIGITFFVTSLVTYILTSMYYKRSMINFVRKSRMEFRRLVDQKESPYAIPIVTKVADPADYATIRMSDNPAYGTQTDATVKMDTDIAYAVTNITT